MNPGLEIPTETPRILNFASEGNLPLAKNAKHKFAAAHALCIYPANAIYTFIPKNACSTLRFSIAVANGCIPSDGDVRWIHKNNPTFSADLRSLVTSSYTFVILRCPFERLVSAFLDKVVDMHPMAWSLTPTSEGDLNPADLTFRKFVILLSSKNGLRSDIHWRPQADFLVYRAYDRYFDFHDMVEVKRELFERIGLGVKDVRDKTGHSISRFERTEGRFADTPVREILTLKREKKLPTLASLFDAEIWDTVAELYRKDAAIYRDLAGGITTVRPDFST